MSKVFFITTSSTLSKGGAGAPNMGGAGMPCLGGAGAPAFVVQVYQHSAALVSVKWAVQAHLPNWPTALRRPFS